MFDKLFGKKFSLPVTFKSVSSSRKFEVFKNDFGIITYETSLIERIAKRTALNINGIHKAEVKIDTPDGDSPLKLHFELVIKQGYSVNELNKNLSDKVHESLKNFCGIENEMIYVKVTDVERPERKSRVK